MKAKKYVELSTFLLNGDFSLALPTLSDTILNFRLSISFNSLPWPYYGETSRVCRQTSPSEALEHLLAFDPPLALKSLA